MTDIIPPLPYYPLQPGALALAEQVNADLAAIVASVNANATSTNPLPMLACSPTQSGYTPPSATFDASGYAPGDACGVTAFGDNSAASMSDGSVGAHALGWGSVASADNTGFVLAYGFQANATIVSCNNGEAIALGFQAQANADTSDSCEALAIGYAAGSTAAALAAIAIAIGKGSAATANHDVQSALAVGFSASATTTVDNGGGAAAFGDTAVASHSGATAIGNKATVNYLNGTALGSGAIAYGPGEVAIGSGAAASGHPLLGNVSTYSLQANYAGGAGSINLDIVQGTTGTPIILGEDHAVAIEVTMALISSANFTLSAMLTSSAVARMRTTAASATIDGTGTQNTIGASGITSFSPTVTFTADTSLGGVQIAVGFTGSAPAVHISASARVVRVF